MSYRTIGRLLAASAAVVLAAIALAPAAVADHGEGHNGETLELSKSEGLVDGEVVTVTLTSWLPGNTATVVTCYIFPAAGPGDCELSNYGTYSTTIADDGTGTVEYPVAIIPGRCDETMPCFVVPATASWAANRSRPSIQRRGRGGAGTRRRTPKPEPAPEPEPARGTRTRACHLNPATQKNPNRNLHPNPSPQKNPNPSLHLNPSPRRTRHPSLHPNPNLHPNRTRTRRRTRARRRTRTRACTRTGACT